MRILDLCTGTGCIPLLLHAILSTKIRRLEILGVDISSTAIALAKRNLHHNVAKGFLPLVAKEQIRFVKGDIFEGNLVTEGDWDIVVSNPPYISPLGFNKDTSRSVRNYEPRVALVPPEIHANAVRRHDGGDDASHMGDRDSMIGDAFYPQILEIANLARARLTLVEVADIAQARRTASLGIRSGRWQSCEIWRDWPNDRPSSETSISGFSVGVLGEGNERSVLFRR
jgi:HemK-like putative methylase